MGKEIDYIKEKYFKIAEKIKAQPKNVFFYETKQDYGYPYIEFINNTYYYIVTERGIELERKSTTDSDELLRWLILDLTRAEAQDYELTHRDNSEDSRRRYFSKQLELLQIINPKWAGIEKARYNKILAEHPFTDDKQPRDLE